MSWGSKDKKNLNNSVVDQTIILGGGYKGMCIIEFVGAGADAAKTISSVNLLMGDDTKVDIKANGTSLNGNKAYSFVDEPMTPEVVVTLSAAPVDSDSYIKITTHK